MILLLVELIQLSVDEECKLKQFAGLVLSFPLTESLHSIPLHIVDSCRHILFARCTSYFDIFSSGTPPNICKRQINESQTAKLVMGYSQSPSSYP